MATAEERWQSAKDMLARVDRVKDAAHSLGMTEDALTSLCRRRGVTASSLLGKRPIEIVPPGHVITGISTHIDGQGTTTAQWIKTKQTDGPSLADFTAALDEAMEKYNGLAKPAPAPILVADNLMTVYPLGDPHIGMLAWARETGADFDLKIAEADLVRAIDILVDQSIYAKRGVLVNVGDFFHTEDNRKVTPASGNQLDGDSRQLKVMETGFTIMLRLISRLLQKHDTVEVVNVPGNHDPNVARMLVVFLRAYYINEPRVTIIDNADPLIYIRHGKVLLGCAHGDSIKMEQLPGIMASDRPRDWGETEYRLWLTGHIHHESCKEFAGCSVESFRTLAPKDYWAHWKGYRARQSLSSITFDKEYGEMFRGTVDLRLVRAAA